MPPLPHAYPCVQIVGDLGGSEWMPLSGGDSCFARGAVDTFNVSGVDVNDLSHLAVRLVSVGTGEDWMGVGEASGPDIFDLLNLSLGP